MRGISVLFFWLFAIGTAVAADYLEPPHGILSDIPPESDYELKLRTIFADAFEDAISARVVIIPPNRPEIVVALEQSNAESYSILTLTPEVSMWGYDSFKKTTDDELRADGLNEKQIAEMRSAYSEDFRLVKLSRCKTAIEAQQAHRILAVWKAMLLQTRYIEHGMVGTMDGVDFSFSMHEPGYVLSGQTSSPSYSTNPGRLVAIAYAMKDLCEHSTNKALDELTSRLADLETHIGK